MTATSILGLTALTSSQAVPETTVNENEARLEQGATWFGKIKDRDLTAPPGAPAQRDCYLVAAGATGAWAGHDGEIAFWLNTAWEFIALSEGMGGWIADENIAVVYDGAALVELAASGGGSYTLTLALSDLTSDLTTGAGKGYWDPPFPIVISSVSASVAEAPTGAAVQVNINEAGVSILSTKITIDAGEVRSADSATPPVISDATIAGRLTFDIDQVGSTSAGKGAQVTIEYSAA